MSKTDRIGASSDPQPLRPGERTNAAGKPIANSLLLSIPDGEFALIRAYLQFVALPRYRKSSRA